MGRWAIIVILTALIAGGGCGYYWYYRNYIKPRRYQQAVGELGAQCSQGVAAPAPLNNKGTGIPSGQKEQQRVSSALTEKLSPVLLPPSGSWEALLCSGVQLRPLRGSLAMEGH